MITIRLGATGHAFLSSRPMAKYLRESIDTALRAGADEIVLDFSGVEAVTDSFTDELLGALIATADRDILPLLRFKGCTEAVRSAIEALLHEVTARRAGAV